MEQYFTWTPLELWANIFTAVCIVLAGRNNVHTWWTGIVGCVLMGWLFFENKLYADATLQVFFLITGAIGWVYWKKESIAPKITNVPWSSLKYMVLGALITTAMYGTILHKFTDAYAPLIDSAVLAFSVLAQFLLMRRNLQTWYFWIAVNTISVPLFWSRELYMTSALYAVFWVNAVYSAYNWKKLEKAQ